MWSSRARASSRGGLTAPTIAVSAWRSNAPPSARAVNGSTLRISSTRLRFMVAANCSTEACDNCASVLASSGPNRAGLGEFIQQVVKRRQVFVPLEDDALHGRSGHRLIEQPPYLRRCRVGVTIDQ